MALDVPEPADRRQSATARAPDWLRL